MKIGEDRMQITWNPKKKKKTKQGKRTNTTIIIQVNIPETERMWNYNTLWKSTPQHQHIFWEKLLGWKKEEKQHGQLYKQVITASLKDQWLSSAVILVCYLSHTFPLVIKILERKQNKTHTQKKL